LGTPGEVAEQNGQVKYTHYLLTEEDAASFRVREAYFEQLKVPSRRREALGAHACLAVGAISAHRAFNLSRYGGRGSRLACRRSYGSDATHSLQDGGEVAASRLELWWRSTTSSRVILLVDTDRLMAAINSPDPLRMGTAIDRSPISSSWSLNEYPRERTSSISSITRCTFVCLCGVSAGRDIRFRTNSIFEGCFSDNSTRPVLP
jgi:hypothetical protein